MRQVNGRGGFASTGSPGPSNGVGTAEVYGFVGWISSSVAYVIYMLWAYVPASVLEAHGVTYYPSKHWAVAVPAWVCVTVVFVYWLYNGLCMAAVPAPSAVASHSDWASRCKEEAGMASYFSDTSSSIPPLVDIPQELVSSILYGDLTPQEAEEQYDRVRRKKDAVE
ncbi:Phosphatidylinositol N-acetylglucosaminyltransferase subunit P [Chlorella vulgaris]